MDGDDEHVVKFFHQAPLSKAVEAKNFDLLLNLLPLYGHLKLKYLLRKSSYDTAVNFIKKNPSIYNQFKSELAPVGVQMPELRDINWNVIGDYEIQIIHDCVKETNIRNAVNEEYLEYLQNYFDTNVDKTNHLINKAREAGIVIDENLDQDAVSQALLNAFIPNISSFIPTIINIAVWAQSAQIFGR